ncbi:MAG: hypothetical protein WA005_01535 [Candidatus Binataceae bacterium]
MRRVALLILLLVTIYALGWWALLTLGSVSGPAGSWHLWWELVTSGAAPTGWTASLALLWVCWFMWGRLRRVR